MKPVNRDLKKPKGKNNNGKPLLKVLKWILIILFLLFLILLATQPLRGRASTSYIDSGDKFLAQKEYVRADLEYQKALILSPNCNQAKERQVLAKNVAGDISAVKNLNGNALFISIVDKINSASGFPGNETEAVRQSRQLIEEGEYQLAIIPAKTALEMDPNYRDAWLYLGLANLKAATLIQIWPDIAQEYLNKSKTAFSKVNELDPTYKIPSEWTNY